MRNSNDYEILYKKDSQFRCGLKRAFQEYVWKKQRRNLRCTNHPKFACEKKDKDDG